MLNNQEKKPPLLIRDLGVIFPSETSKEKRRCGIYKCDCGKEFKAITHNTNRSREKSCGCLKTIHGLESHKLYQVWNSMVQRCNNHKNKAYKNYGARGIKVCASWLNIKNFIEDMEPTFIKGLTLDRIDVNQNYEPYNCRWSTRAVQSRNTRKIRSSNTSGYRGVSFNKRNNNWVARIGINGKNIYLGRFDEAKEAAKAYDNYVIANNLEHTINEIAH
ncbi:MAG: AP2 domain-containing protein [Candidatus Cloacimonas sp.]